MTTFLHYFCYIFHTHCFLVNILLYVVIISMCIFLYKMKRKTETNIQSKCELFIDSLIITLLSHSYSDDFKFYKMQNGCR